MVALCVASSLGGAFVRVLLENRRAQRSSRTNWSTFLVCAIFGVPLAWSLSEWLFLSQPWARNSKGLICMLGVVIGSNGQGIALELSETVTAATKELGQAAIAKGKQLLGALVAPISPSVKNEKDEKP